MTERIEAEIKIMKNKKSKARSLKEAKAYDSKIAELEKLRIETLNRKIFDVDDSIKKKQIKQIEKEEKG